MMMNYSPWDSLDQNTGVGSCSLLQGIFPTQESIRGLLQADSLSTELQGSPNKIEKEVKDSPVPIASTVINIIYWNSTFFFF